MGEGPGNILVVSTSRLHRGTVDWIASRYGDSRVQLLPLDRPEAEARYPADWEVVDVARLSDPVRLGEDFLGFLDAWPRRAVSGGRSFDEIFRTPEGYSVWWLAPRMERHPDMPFFLKFRKFWLFRRLLASSGVDRVVLNVGEADLAGLLASECRRRGCGLEFAPGAAVPSATPWGGRWRWLFEAGLRLLLLPWLSLVRACLARLLFRHRIEPQTADASPIVLVTIDYPKHVQLTAEGPVVWFHRDLVNQLTAKCPGIRVRYLARMMTTRAGRKPFVKNFYQRGWRVLREIREVCPPEERHPCFFWFLKSLPYQAALLARYMRLERTPAFRQSFDLDGSDMSWLFVGPLRHAVANVAPWSRSVEAVARILRAEPNLRVFLATEEMYVRGALEIAAAKKAGIPTLGLQHGTVFPMHLVYRLPKGQVAGTPIPDHFAAYGEYARTVLSEWGAYPAERVWITGSPRFDHMVLDPPDAVAARSRLNLPANERIVLVATQIYPWFHDAVRAVLTTLRNRKGVTVCVKLHPQDTTIGTYRRMAQEVEAGNVRFHEEGFDDLLAACDVLVSGSSTTVLEAILLGRTTVCMNFSAEPDRYPYVEEGVSLPGHDPAELAESLSKALDAATASEMVLVRERFLKRHLGPTLHGRAAEALANTIIREYGIRTQAPCGCAGGP